MKKASTDERLLIALRENARTPTAELARQLNLSRTTVQSRIERLERQGVIAGYTVQLSDEYERGHIRAHIMIEVRPKEMPSVSKAMRAIKEVRILHSVSGVFDMIAVAATPTVVEMDEVIDRIGAIDGVMRTSTSIVLSTKIRR